MRVAGVLVADAICFDVAYDEGICGQVARGAQLVTVQTSNAMFSRTGQLAQQFEISRLRAQETGRWVVVAAINGISGVVRPDGDGGRLRPGARSGGAGRDRRAEHDDHAGRPAGGLAGAASPWPSSSCHTLVVLVTYRRRRRGDRAVAADRGTE